MAKSTSGTQGVKVFGFVLVPGFSLITLSCAIEAFRLTNERSQRVHFVYRTIGIASTTVPTNDGIVLTVDRSIDDNEQYDVIFIISSLSAVEFYDDHLAAWLRSRARSGVTIAPVGSAVVLAAKIGLLNGYRCATNWLLHSDFAEHFPDVLASQDLFCFDRDRLTSAGGLSTIDFGFAIVSQTVERDLAAEVAALAEITMLSRIRPATDSQRMAVLWRYRVYDARVTRSIELMESHIERPLPLAQIARASGISVRQLERQFQKHLGKRPLRMYLEIRLRRGRDMLSQSTDSILVIALKCGFADAAHFSRQFKVVYDETPAAVRWAATGFRNTVDRLVPYGRGMIAHGGGS